MVNIPSIEQRRGPEALGGRVVQGPKVVSRRHTVLELVLPGPNVARRWRVNSHSAVIGFTGIEWRNPRPTTTVARCNGRVVAMLGNGYPNPGIPAGIRWIL